MAVLAETSIVQIYISAYSSDPRRTDTLSYITAGLIYLLHRAQVGVWNFHVKISKIHWAKLAGLGPQLVKHLRFLPDVDIQSISE